MGGWSRWLVVLALLSSGALAGSCYSDDAENPVPCEGHVSIFVHPLPVIGTATWDVTVCQNDTCDSANVDGEDRTADLPGNPSHVKYSDYVGGVGLEMYPDKSKLVLGLFLFTPEHDGDVWSVTVVDDQGKMVFSGKKAVSYGSGCPDVQITLDASAS